ILILDEPVDGLDPVMRRQVWSIIMQDVAERNTTVLVSSHNLRELEDVCDRVGIIDKGRLLLERSLSDLQENIAKIQIVLPDGASLPQGLDIIHENSPGRLKTLIVRGKASETTNILSSVNPLFMDVVPLNLEEIFIYELGGADYAVKDIIL
ncbi:MAG TPA: ABC transporter, partial [Clostridiales bacterium]|nr:ABC transporter [Clostridiales bacterium]